MNTLNDIKAELARHRGDLAERFRVKDLAVFGSFARGDHGPESDVDILVDFTRPIGIEFMDLADELEQILHRRVDLVSKRGVNERYFRRIEPQLSYV